MLAASSGPCLRQIGTPRPAHGRHASSPGAHRHVEDVGQHRALGPGLGHQPQSLHRGHDETRQRPDIGPVADLAGDLAAPQRLVDGVLDGGSSVAEPRRQRRVGDRQLAGAVAEEAVPRPG